MNGTIITLAGEAGAGKDSVADVLVDQLGFVKLGFANPLRRLCYQLFGWNIVRLVSDTRLGTAFDYKKEPSDHRPDWMEYIDIPALVREQFPPTGKIFHAAFNFQERAAEHLHREFRKIKPTWSRRDIMRHVGTECFRALDDLHWVKQAMLEADRIQADVSPRVVFTDTRFWNEVDAIRARNGLVCSVSKAGGEKIAPSEHASEVEIQAIMKSADMALCAPAGEMAKLKQRALTLGYHAVGRSGS